MGNKIEELMDTKAKEPISDKKDEDEQEDKEKEEKHHPLRGEPDVEEGEESPEIDDEDEDHEERIKEAPELLQIQDLSSGFSIKLGSSKIDVIDLANLSLKLRDDWFSERNTKRKKGYCG
jgi:hypothetical protein